MDFYDRELEHGTRFLYTGKEQRREAKEKYEEKCERNIVSKQLHKPRWCPPLEEYKFVLLSLKILQLMLYFKDGLNGTKL